MSILVLKMLAPPIRCFYRVKAYKAIEGPLYAWEIETPFESTPNSSAPVYFILDSMNQAAFSHWVYENATWLPTYKTILEKYPSCKLVLQEMKQYKRLFLKHYGISEEKICFPEDIEPNNFCFFHTYISLNEKDIPPIYYEHLNTFSSSLDKYKVIKTIPLLYLPRGTKENLQGPNNRSYNVQERLKEFVKEIGGTVYETDTTTSLEEQIRLVKSAKVIILDYGSNLWVNGLFAENSAILCLNIGWQQHTQFPALEAIWNRIHETNTVTQVFAYTSEEKEGEPPVVCFHLPTILQTLSHLLEISRDRS